MGAGKSKGQQKLWHYAEEGNYAKCKKYVKKCHSVNHPQEETGDTAVHLAARGGFDTIVDLLVLHGGSNDVLNLEGKRPSDIACTDDFVAEERFPKVYAALGIPLNAQTMCQAAEKGDLDLVKLCVKHGVNASAHDEKEVMAIEYACRTGRLPIVEYLMENKAKFQTGTTCIHDAARGGYIDILEYLVSKGQTVGAIRMGKEESVLGAAAAGGQVKMCTHLLSKYEPYLESDDVEGNTPLLAASKAGFASTVTLLIEWGANKNATDKQGRNAAEVAHLWEKEGVASREWVKGIVGASIEEEAEEVREALRTAVHKPEMVAASRGEAGKNDDGGGGGEVTAVAATTAAASSPSPPKENGEALVEAATNGDVETVKTCHKAGVAIDSSNDLGKTAIEFACARGHLDVVQYCVENGAKYQEGTMCITEAARCGHTDVIDYLVTCGADVNATDGKAGHSALVAAAYYAQTSTVEHLIEIHSADLSSRDGDGNTALHAAAMGGHAAVVKVLVEAGADKEAKNDKGHVPEQIIGVMDLTATSLDLTAGPPDKGPVLAALELEPIVRSATGVTALKEEKKDEPNEDVQEEPASNVDVNESKSDSSEPEQVTLPEVGKSTVIVKKSDPDGLEAVSLTPAQMERLAAEQEEEKKTEREETAEAGQTEDKTGDKPGDMPEETVETGGDDVKESEDAGKVADEMEVMDLESDEDLC